ncbi:MAG: hypothetical protein GYA87_09405 [Christensenellaceae bacterium]|nr:hypothetical protein [Christensenellaceae bacterium]
MIKTVKELKEQLNKLPDELPVFLHVNELVTVSGYEFSSGGIDKIYVDTKINADDCYYLKGELNSADLKELNDCPQEDVAVFVVYPY